MRIGEDIILKKFIKMAVEAVAVASIAVLSTTAMASAAPRIDVPVKTISHGSRTFYWVPIQVGGRTVKALLDSGSSGLRVLSDSASPKTYHSTSRTLWYQFGNGQRATGIVAKATVALGGATATVPIHVVQHVGCGKAFPHCHEAGTKGNETSAGVFGKRALPAILGVNMPHIGVPSSMPLKNPLIQIGDRWIIKLPASSEDTGSLIINPTEAELKGFTVVRSVTGSSNGGVFDNPVNGCLINDQVKKRYCGPVVFDTGTPQIDVIANSRNKQWKPGGTASFEFSTLDHKKIHARFRISSSSSGSGSVHIGRFPAAKKIPVVVIAGVEPYRLFSVLYDYKNGAIGLKRR